MNNVLIKKTIGLYSDNKFVNIFSRIRFWDAPFEEINKLAPNSGVILDLGCGDGILSNYLALNNKQRKLIGIELNKNRVSRADRGLKNTKFIYGNVLTKSFPKADIILLTHLLHHLPSKLDQEKLIIKCKKNLNPNGKLIITEVIEKPFLKYIISWLVDAFVVPILFEKKLYDFNFIYRKDKQWQDLIRKTGLKINIYYPHKNKPFSHVIYVCKKIT